MAWLKNNLYAIAGILLALLGAGGAAVYFRKKALSEKELRRVSEAEGRFKEMRGKRKEIVRSVGESDERIREIDGEIMEIKTEVVRNLQRIEHMSTSDVVREFNRLYGKG